MVGDLGCREILEQKRSPALLVRSHFLLLMSWGDVNTTFYLLSAASIIPPDPCCPCEICRLGQTLGFTTLTRSGFPDQRCKEGPLYIQGLSRRNLLTAAVEVKGIFLEGNASASCTKPNNAVMGLTFSVLHIVETNTRYEPNSTPK